MNNQLFILISNFSNFTIILEYFQQTHDLLFLISSAPPPTAVTSELWGVPMAKPRGPPPGLAKGGSISLAAANGWNSTSVGGGRGAVSGWGSQGGSSGNWGSLWLLLRNLTAQVSLKFLRTLYRVLQMNMTYLKTYSTVISSYNEP